MRLCRRHDGFHGSLSLSLCLYCRSICLVCRSRPASLSVSLFSMHLRRHHDGFHGSLTLSCRSICLVCRSCPAPLSVCPPCILAGVMMDFMVLFLSLSPRLHLRRSCKAISIQYVCLFLFVSLSFSFPISACLSLSVCQSLSLYISLVHARPNTILTFVCFFLVCLPVRVLPMSSPMSVCLSVPPRLHLRPSRQALSTHYVCMFFCCLFCLLVSYLCGFRPLSLHVCLSLPPLSLRLHLRRSRQALSLCLSVGVLPLSFSFPILSVCLFTSPSFTPGHTHSFRSHVFSCCLPP